jgi:hypothetical protein
MARFVILLALASGAAMAGVGQLSGEDRQTPPKVIDPGSTTQPPADAIVLFAGSDLSKWRHPDGEPARWPIENGAMTVRPGSGGILSTVTFEAAQVHVEFATPAEVRGTGQGRGNSGVYLQARYEVQVLDSYHNETYFDGQCGAIYGQHPPLVNACRPPGAWQSYDIIFHPPTFDENGTRTAPATMTVLHNGVLIQDHVEVRGETSASSRPEGPGPGPLYLQDHGCTVSYRNIWIRPLE